MPDPGEYCPLENKDEIFAALQDLYLATNRIPISVNMRPEEWSELVNARKAAKLVLDKIAGDSRW